MWGITDALLGSIRRRIEQLVSRLDQFGLESLKQEIKSCSEFRVQSNHEDRKLLRPFPLPLIILGTKYDLFEFISKKDDSSMKRVKVCLSHIASGTRDAKSLRLVDGMLVVHPNMDTYSDIGVPPTIGTGVSKSATSTQLDAWVAVFCAQFPQQISPTSVTNRASSGDPSKDFQYAEPLVDEARGIKDAEYEKLQPKRDKRIRELLQQLTVEGVRLA